MARTKNLLLSLIILLPLAVVGFLYVFGRNHYTVQKSAYKQVRIASLGQTAIIVYAPVLDARRCVILNRALSRLDDLVGHGRFCVEILSAEKDAKACMPMLEHASMRQPQSGQITAGPEFIEQSGAKNLLLPKESVRASLWALLADSKGQVRNAYNLTKEDMLDSLATETLIVLEEDR